MANRGSVDLEAEFPDGLHTRAQRGGRRGGMAPERKFSAQEDPNHPQMLSLKNMSLAQLIYFYKKKEQEGKLTAESTCWQVVKDVLIPETAKQGCAYMDLVDGNPKKPEVMVCHWWGSNFRELVLGVAQHATGILNRELLERKTFAGSVSWTGFAQMHLDKTYWLCMFAANHHKKKGEGHPVVEVAALTALVGLMHTVLVVLDRDLGVLSRAWCALEIWEAKQCGKDLHFATGRVGDCWRRGEAVFPGMEKCSTSEPGDKARILKHCDYEIGVATFNQFLQETTLPGIRATAWAWAVRELDFSLLHELLAGRANIDGPLNRVGETALTYACQHTNPALVQLLLDSQANPDVPSMGGWTPLHYAVQTGHEGLTRTLLGARADAACAAQNGRSALIDASERGYWALARLLLDARADPAHTDLEGYSALFFVKDLDDKTLATRLGWSSEEKVNTHRIRRSVTSGLL